MKLVEKWLTRKEVEIPKVEIDTSALPTDAAKETTLGAVQAAVELLDDVVSGSGAQVDIVASLPAGTNTIGNVGQVPLTAGGCSIFRSIDLDETEEEVKGSAGQLYGYSIMNLNAAQKRYVKIYDGTAASVVVGTTTPVMTVALNANERVSLVVPLGLAFNSGITVAAVTGVLDSSTGAPGANDVVMNVFYK